MKIKLSDKILKYMDETLKLIKSTTMNIEEAYVVGDNENVFSEQKFLYIRYEDGSETLRCYPSLEFAAGKKIKDDRLKNMKFKIFKNRREAATPSLFSFEDLKSSFMNSTETKSKKFFANMGIHDDYMVSSYYTNEMSEEDKARHEELKNLF